MHLRQFWWVLCEAVFSEKDMWEMFYKKLKTPKRKLPGVR